MANAGPGTPLPSPLDEAVLTWLAGAALASGATRLSFFLDSPSRRLTLVDDGAGLPPAGFSRCHGFRPSPVDGPHLPEGPARNLGAAIRPALLVAGVVTIEARRDGRRAVRFSLNRGGGVGVRRVRARGLVREATGTAVTLLFPDRSSPLLDPRFVTDRLLKRFSSLLPDGPSAGGVAISVDGIPVVPPSPPAVPEEAVSTAASKADGLADLAGVLNATVTRLLPDYPELAPVVGAILPETPRAPAVGERAAFPDGGDVFDSADLFGGGATVPPPVPAATASPATPPSIELAWEEDPTRDEPGRMDGTTLILNRLHPAWEAAERDGAFAYHAAICLAMSLFGRTDPDRTPGGFLSRFLEHWGAVRG